jgi:hypothetical protein
MNTADMKATFADKVLEVGREPVPLGMAARRVELERVERLVENGERSPRQSGLGGGLGERDRERPIADLDMVRQA